MQSQIYPIEYRQLSYLNGFGNHFQSQAIKGTLPIGQNSPQSCQKGLYPQQLSGTAFTVPKHSNKRSWLYRRLPTVKHLPWKQCKKKRKIINSFFEQKHLSFTPTQFRFNAMPDPNQDENFIDSWITLAGAGDPSMKNGLAIYSFSTKTSMNKQAFYSADGDLLIVPYQGILCIKTEFGKITVKQRQIIIIPRGIVFNVQVCGISKGWISQIYKGHFKLPDLGPIGSNGLANTRDFQTPKAWFDKQQGQWTIYNKYCGRFFKHTRESTPFDVVAWHGNYYPYKYNLDLFNAINTVTFDHPDPSIFTVLTCPTDQIGTALLDLVIFPPRWMVAQHTFRPPYYHRNCMSQFMGNISGNYDAKQKGFGKGKSSLHSTMSGHGPDAQGNKKAKQAKLQPVRYPYENLAFMFESSLMLKTTQWAMDLGTDDEYYKCWQQLQKAKIQ